MRGGERRRPGAAGRVRRRGAVVVRLPLDDELLARGPAEHAELHVPAVATAEKILELATKAEILYKSQNPGEQRRLLETVLSNCTFDRGSLKPTYTSPFDLLVRGNETRNWRRGWDSNPTGLSRFCKIPWIFHSLIALTGPTIMAVHHG